MRQRIRGHLVGLTAVAAGLAAAGLAAFAQVGPSPSSPQGAQAVPKTAGETYKNVQVLKDIPADQLVPTMRFVAASLGVECGFCHVPKAFEKDDKKTKQTARKMMRMVLAIDRANFDGELEVTCYSCHRGATKPVSVPAIPAEEPAREAMRPEGATPAPTPALPSADQILDRWAQAIGGAGALEKITSRVQEGTITAFGGHEFPIEILAQAPDKRLSIMKMPRGESITAVDGHTGWLSGRNGPQRMSPMEVEAARMDADFYFPINVKKLFARFRVRSLEKLADRDVYVVVAVNPDRPPVELYFDSQSGLLVRLVRYTETALGNDPTQIDYGDYREVDGVEIPFRWTLARPLGRFTIQVETTKQNVPIDDSRFAMPSTPATG
jgi:photosynthetic reaction center cytochrome c subunit